MKKHLCVCLKIMALESSLLYASSRISVTNPSVWPLAGRRSLRSRTEHQVQDCGHGSGLTLRLGSSLGGGRQNSPWQSFKLFYGRIECPRFTADIIHSGGGSEKIFQRLKTRGVQGRGKVESFAPPQQFLSEHVITPQPRVSTNWSTNKKNLKNWNENLSTGSINLQNQA